MSQKEIGQAKMNVSDAIIAGNRRSFNFGQGALQKVFGVVDQHGTASANRMEPNERLLGN